ncbi:MAG TPA: GDP-mannose 4,6-dehydratase [Candidatus Limnocylindrales bacterium]|nr:GDP-mannose 4,6-dehydratase [Candidatus Limnocylindrales bacterium]
MQRSTAAAPRSPPACSLSAGATDRTHAGGSSQARPRRIFITGVAGQDGWYLAQQLAGAGHLVTGLVLPGQQADAEEIRTIEGDLRDVDSLVRAIDAAAPDEIYNLAAATFVPASWEAPDETRTVNALGVRNLVAAMLRAAPSARLCHASSAEIFGPPTGRPQDEDHPMLAASPYGLAKAEAHKLIAETRAGGVFACSAILFNHESPRRPPSFVTRKITMAAARIARGLGKEPVALGNLRAARDWGYAPEYVEAMQRMLAAGEPRDYVVATGRATTVGRFAELAFARAGLDWRQHVVSDPVHEREGDSEARIGNPSRIERELGWKAATSVEALVRIMVDADLALPAE